MVDQPAVIVDFDRARRWLFDDALPLWSMQGVDRKHGGYAESLTLDGFCDSAKIKRTRVMARQLYVFSHASMIGWSQGLEVARHGFSFLRGHAWLGDQKGWARAMSVSGKVVDDTPDLYDIAFAVFSISWYFRVSRDPAAVELIERTFDFLDQQMRWSAGGFVHEKPRIGPLQQNPHMHLLEACLACIQSEPSPELSSRAVAFANELVELFSRRFFDGRNLAEYFSDDWSRLPGEKGRITEPGHQFEWAWILSNHQQLTGRDNTILIRNLISFAERYGVDPSTGRAYQQVRDDGMVLDRGARTWPQTERIKAYIALFDRFGERHAGAIQQSVDVLFESYLSQPRAGLWIERFEGDGTPNADSVPASTFYHVFLAFAELLRIEAPFTFAD